MTLGWFLSHSFPSSSPNPRKIIKGCIQFTPSANTQQTRLACHMSQPLLHYITYTVFALIGMYVWLLRYSNGIDCRYCLKYIDQQWCKVQSPSNYWYMAMSFGGWTEANWSGDSDSLLGFFVLFWWYIARWFHSISKNLQTIFKPEDECWWTRYCICQWIEHALYHHRLNRHVW